MASWEHQAAFESECEWQRCKKETSGSSEIGIYCSVGLVEEDRVPMFRVWRLQLGDELFD